MATETRKSDSVEWRDTPEVFQFARNQWDVAQAKELIRTKRPRTIGTMDISGVADLVGKPPVDGVSTICLFGIAVDWSVAASDDVDLEVPIILVPYRDSFIPIDGWHRIAKAKVRGVTELPCVVMTKAETKLIKVN
jgi:hypothetical protein